MLGLIHGEKIQPGERLGALRCTLSQVKAEREGAGSGPIITVNGHPNQNWPEVYLGLSLIVHRAYQLMPIHFKDAMDLHYVWAGLSAPVKARRMGITVSNYWSTVANMKSCLYGAVIITRGVQSRINDPIDRRDGAASHQGEWAPGGSR